MITREEIIELTNEDIVRIYQDLESQFTKREKELAATVLIEKNIGLITSTLKHFTTNKRTSWDELMQAGRYGIFYAAKRYKFNEGTQFHTFAVSQIKAAILDELNKATSNSSNHYMINEKKIKMAIADIQAIKGANYYPNADEIRSCILANRGEDIPTTTIERCMVGSRQNEAQSLDDDNFNHSIPDLTATCEEIVDQQYMKSDVEKALDRLPPAERFVLIHKHGFVNGIEYSDSQIANLMNQQAMFIKMNKGKKISNFIVGKYAKNGELLISRDAKLQVYGQKVSALAKVKEEWNMETISTKAACDFCDEIGDSILRDFFDRKESMDDVI
ncbi:sigma-70 family RNA polymerase sigma factor [Ruminococcus albus]|uniref:RNA polymerase, sigma 28 subunit, FliA/WhiG subfamily n=1 Tax=Ruminococcus albus (strain ATCC 27210 / DSM 20455 / JCM 14654 / NCDO 2250 / 7) TaxID=697329 RepID=E6UKB7_RUMA7|nr:sigma-70 family RNA polymerase sigma factor [Ruminococcus albus]ADU24113.1 RNA polymerase, sigma 28 subunit, FliA/WhiG subfamily [Ruminococcus albus 7 = DSM 20455]